MFTGIIAGTATILSVKSLQNGKEFRIHLDSAADRLQLGDSIALNGVCTTALHISKSEFTIQVLPETLTKTTFSIASVGDPLNWETSATPTTALGGHIVYGHVDEIGRVGSWSTGHAFNELTIHYSSQFRPYLIPKGSICINGISLTVVDVSERYFTCHIIPHTATHTVLNQLSNGSQVNLEYDIVAKYLYNFTNVHTKRSDQNLLETIKKAGLS